MDGTESDFDDKTPATATQGAVRRMVWSYAEETKKNRSLHEFIFVTGGAMIFFGTISVGMAATNHWGTYSTITAILFLSFGVLLYSKGERLSRPDLRSIATFLIAAGVIFGYRWQASSHARRDKTTTTQHVAPDYNEGEEP